MASEGKEERTSAAQLRAEAKQAGDSASEHAKESGAEYKQQVHKAGLSALKGAEENYQSAKGTAVEEKDRLLDYATQTKNTATDNVQEYTEAAKKKLGDLGQSTQQKYEQIKKQTAETAENALNNEASEPARQAAGQEEDKSSNSQNM
jgi:gas vesicle protein